MTRSNGWKGGKMKYKTTAKELRRYYPNNRTIAIGYCNAQYLLYYQNPNCYTCGVYGWNFDGYELQGNTTLITTGYRGTYGIRPDFDTLRDYEKRAETVIHSREKTYEKKKSEVNALLFEFIDKTIRRG